MYKLVRTIFKLFSSKPMYHDKHEPLETHTESHVEITRVGRYKIIDINYIYKMANFNYIDIILKFYRYNFIISVFPKIFDIENFWPRLVLSYRNETHTLRPLAMRSEQGESPLL